MTDETPVPAEEPVDETVVVETEEPVPAEEPVEAEPEPAEG